MSTFTRLSFCSSLLLAGISTADTILVPSGGDIQAAINIMSDGDTIQLEAGTYLPDSTLDPNGKALTILGVAGKTGQPLSVIDGQGLILIIECSSGEDAGTVFQNLDIRNSELNLPGMSNVGSSPTVIDCTFFDNGGGMRNTKGSSPTVSGCVFRENITGADGAGMLNIENSSPGTCMAF